MPLLEFESLPLTDYQRSQILVLKDIVDENTDVEIVSEIIDPRYTAEEDSKPPPTDEPPERRESLSNSHSNESGRTAALYQQLELAKQLRRKLETSVQQAQHAAELALLDPSQDPTPRVHETVKDLLGGHREDILQLVSLSEAAYEGYTLSSYTQYVDEFKPNHSSDLQAIQAVREQSIRMVDEKEMKKRTKKRKRDGTEPLPSGAPICQDHLPEKPVDPDLQQRLKSLLERINHHNTVKCYFCEDSMDIWHSDTIPSDTALSSVVSRQVIRLHCKSKGHEMLWEAASPWDFVSYSKFLSSASKLGSHLVLAFTFVHGRVYLLPKVEVARKEKMTPYDILQFYLDRLEETFVNVLDYIVKHIPGYDSRKAEARLETWIPGVVHFIRRWQANLKESDSTVRSACTESMKALGVQIPGLELMMARRINCMHRQYMS